MEAVYLLDRQRVFAPLLVVLLLLATSSGCVARRADPASASPAANERLQANKGARLVGKWARIGVAYGGTLHRESGETIAFKSDGTGSEHHDGDDYPFRWKMTGGREAFVHRWSASIGDGDESVFFRSGRLFFSDNEHEWAVYERVR